MDTNEEVIYRVEEDLLFEQMQESSSYESEQVQCGNDLCAMAWWPKCRCQCKGKNHGKKYEELKKLVPHVTLPQDIDIAEMICSQDHLGL